MRTSRTIGRSSGKPIHVRYRGRDFYTNPPPSAGGLLLAYALALLDREQGPPPLAAVVEAMSAAQDERGEEFMRGLADEAFAERFLAARLGSTTHISVLDGEGMACSVTSTNGEGSGLVVPGTGIHVNNMMGEQDLNPLGFHRHPAGVRLPSMMAPSVLMRDGQVRAGPRQRRIEQDPLGAAAGDRRCRRPRPRRAGGRRCAARAPRGRHVVRRAGDRGRGARPADGPVLGAEPLLRRRAGGAQRPAGAIEGAGTPGTRRRRRGSSRPA